MSIWFILTYYIVMRLVYEYENKNMGAYVDTLYLVSMYFVCCYIIAYTIYTVPFLLLSAINDFFIYIIWL